MGVLANAWRDLGEGPRDLERVRPGGHPELPARLPVADLVRDAVATVSLQAALLAGSDEVALDADRVRTAVTSERHFLLNGARPEVWAELSGFWPTEEGWLRTHTNYPHHRARLLGVLGLSESATKEEFAARLLERRAHDVEDASADAAAVAAAVRGAAEWAAHPQALAVRATPLIGFHPASVAAPRGSLDGVRVLDLTRVIAGPVATRTLAWLGADVLRVDDPTLPELPWQHLDSGAGKRSTLLDLDDRRDRARFDELLATADVLVTGYRPAALERFGFDLRPELVVGTLSAWSESGPWAHRRGFDSIVQAASGIAMIEGGDGPGALPAQALDHSAGYLLAAGVIAALRRGGGSVSVSLARVAQELLELPRPGTVGRDSGAATVVTQQTSVGALVVPLPAPRYRGAPGGWPAPARPWGGDEARWR